MTHYSHSVNLTSHYYIEYIPHHLEQTQPGDAGVSGILPLGEFLPNSPEGSGDAGVSGILPLGPAPDSEGSGDVGVSEITIVMSSV